MRSYDYVRRQCQVCKKEFPSHEVLPAEAVRPNIVPALVLRIFAIF